VVGRARNGKVSPASVDWGGPIEITTWWSALSGGRPLVWYENGDPAVVEVRHGLGRAIVVGFDLGDQYTKPITEACFQVVPAEVAPFPEGYADVVREAAGSFLGALPKEVDADHPLVEVTRMHRDDGGAIVVLSYDNAPVTVTVTAPNLPDQVTNALSGETIAVVDGTVTLELDSAAVLGWTDGGATTGTIPNDPGTDPPTASDGAASPGPAEGCGCGTLRPSWTLAGFVPLLLALRRRRIHGQVGSPYPETMHSWPHTGTGP
jgi:hypothetical protein